MRRRRSRPKAIVSERTVRCPRCGAKLMEVSSASRARGLQIKCRRCRLIMEIEL